MDYLLEMNHISKSYPGVQALDDVSLQLKAGEVHCICGENGAGKSTLMKILSGVCQMDHGSISISGQKVLIDHPTVAQKLGISIIFQELNLFPHLSVADNIWMNRYPKKGMCIDRNKMMIETNLLLEMLGIAIPPSTLVSSLSIAQQQMIEIAKAISFDCKIIVMDEPTATLSEPEIKIFFAMIEKLKAKGVGIFYISHRLEELRYITDRISLLRDGKHIRTCDFSEITIEEIISLMVGRDMDNKYPKYQRHIGEIILEIQKLENSKVHIENLCFKSGEIFAMAGLVGAGRTEFARALLGIDPATEKKLCYQGKPITIDKISDSIVLNMGYITEDRKKDGLALPMSIMENINMTHIQGQSTFGFYKKKEGDALASEFMESLRIAAPDKCTIVKHLSGGNQQKVVLAKWISHPMEVLIFDEPTRGIDVGARYEIYELMNQLSDKGVTIIMISSDLSEVLGMSDRVAVMKSGCIEKILDTSQTSEEEILRYAI